MNTKAHTEPITSGPCCAFSGASGSMQIVAAQQECQWREVIENTAAHDFYHSAGYHQLAQQQGEGDPKMFVYREGDITIALPLLLREVPVPGANTPWKDATSVYGYAGPLCSHNIVPRRMVLNFQDCLHQTLREMGVVSVFSRLHPLIAQEGSLYGIGELKHIGTTVSIDLGLPQETQWSQCRENHRRGILKLHKMGVICEEDLRKNQLSAFVDVYLQTMRRVGARQCYLFNHEYFRDMFEILNKDCHLFTATHNGCVISAGIFIECAGTIQYHLGGTHNDYLHLAPMKLIFDSVRRWGCERKLERLHLGGGVGAQDDSLFAFKAGFSNLRHPFHCWRWVVIPEVYRLLCQTAAQETAIIPSESLTDYFPAYRRLNCVLQTPSPSA